MVSNTSLVTHVYVLDAARLVREMGISYEDIEDRMEANGFGSVSARTLKEAVEVTCGEPFDPDIDWAEWVVKGMVPAIHYLSKQPKYVWAGW